jgi:hypothetical protein
MAGIARWEALLGLPLTTLFHRSESFPDPLHRTLAAITDGSRTVPQISAALAALLVAQRASGVTETEIDGYQIPLGDSEAVKGNGQFRQPRQELEDYLMATVPMELERFRLAALLV